MKKTLFLSIVSLALALPLFAALNPATAFERCRCIKFTTPSFTKVGATCLKARTKARDAARAAAVCPPSAPSCGPVSHTISTCTRLTDGRVGFSASAFANYYCELCIEDPDVPNVP